MPDCIRDIVKNGRKEFLAQWRTLRTPEMTAELHDPCAHEAFERSKLDRSQTNSELHSLHCDLLRLRRADPVISNQQRGAFDGAVLSGRAFVYRVFSEQHGDRLLVVNLGADLHFDAAPEPLLAPAENKAWQILFSSEHPRYGGSGTPPLDTDEGWRIPGQSAVLLA